MNPSIFRFRHQLLPLLLTTLVILVPTASQAANKVVVIPMMGDEVRHVNFISLPVESATINNGASYQLNGGSDLSGMAFPNSGFPRFSTGFALPPTYKVGTDIIVKITWGNSRHNASSCGVRLRSNGVAAFRPNDRPVYTDGVFTGNTNFDGSMVTLSMPGTGEQIRQTIMTIPGTSSNGSTTLYKPGDNFTLRLARQDTDAADTCTGKLFILGMSASF